MSSKKDYVMEDKYAAKAVTFKSEGNSHDEKFGDLTGFESIKHKKSEELAK